MKLETFIIHKTNATVTLMPNLKVNSDGIKKRAAFCIRGEYYKPRVANNLYNRTTPSPKIPKGPWEKIMNDCFPIGDIPCYVIDRGIDIEIIVE